MCPGGGSWPSTATTQITTNPKAISNETEAQSSRSALVFSAAGTLVASNRGVSQKRFAAPKPSITMNKATLTQDEVAVLGAEKTLQPIGHEPRIECAARGKYCHAPGGKSGKPPELLKALEESWLGAERPRPDEHKQRQQAAHPSCGRDEMEHIPPEVN